MSAYIVLAGLFSIHILYACNALTQHEAVLMRTESESYGFDIHTLNLICTYTDITSAQCQNFKVLMVHNSSTGMLVTLASTMKNTTVTLRERNLSNHYLPPECGANNYRCSILHFVRSETSYYIIPSIRGFLILSHSTNYADQEEFRDHVLFVPITEKQCNPTKAFYTGIYVVIACMNLPTGSDGKIFYLRYDFTIPSDDNMGNTVLTDTTFQSEPIYNTMTVSEVIFITEQERCQSTRNLYFIDDKYVVHSPSSLFSRDFVFSTEELQECVGYLEYYGDDIIVIRCTPNKTVLYDTCGAGDFNYQPHDHIPYPCSSWSMIAYHNHTQVSLNRSGEVYVTEAFPFENISYGRCVQGADEPVFIASSADGAIFITRFDGNNFTKITSGNDNGPCLRPVFSENELIFGVCDSRSGSYMIINVTEGCAGDPVIAQIHIPIVPDLVSVSLGQGTYNCSCSTSIQNSELPSTTQMESAPEATQTEGSTSYTMPTAESDAKPTVATNPTVLSAWLGSLSSGVVLIGLAVFVFIM